MQIRYLIVRFDYVNVGLRWSRDGVRDVGTAVEEKVFLPLDDNLPRLAVLVRMRLEDVPLAQIEDVIANDALMERQNGYYNVTGVAELEPAQSMMDALADIDDLK